MRTFQRPFGKNASGEFSPEILVLDSVEYGRPDDLPPGKILVVGSGQTGCQLTEELHLD
jgi:putative flavoprotein involved in K+ transport